MVITPGSAVTPMGPFFASSLMAPSVLGFFALAVFAASALVLWLWNLTIPSVFDGPPLRYWQAFRLVILAWLLVGGMRFV